MNKVEFLLVLERQRGSELSVVDFCGNEGYSVSSFYFWKRKFAPASAPETVSAHPIQASASERIPVPSAPAFGFAPVRLCTPQVIPSSAEAPNNGSDLIWVELPGGVTICFRGADHSRLALDFIRQIYQSDVLPQ